MNARRFRGNQGLVSGAAALILFVVGAVGATAQTLKVTEIPTLGGTTSSGFGINATGQVTGFARDAKGVAHAIVWKPSSPNGASGTIADLGTGKGYAMAFGFGINGSGAVVGTGVNNLGFEHAILYSGGSWSDVIGGGATYQTDAYSVNDLGQVTGSDWTKGAFLSTVVKGKRTVVYIAPGYLCGLVVNKTGQVLVAYGPSRDVALWTPSSPNGTTGTLTSLGISAERAYLNDKGEVAVAGEVYLPAADYGLPAGWSPLPALPPIPGQYDMSMACYGMNNQGQVVGQESAQGRNPDGSYIYSIRSFLWDPVHGTRDLADLLDASGSGWSFNLDNLWGEPTPNPMAINDYGQIVGTATHNGQTRGYLLTPAP